MSHSNSNRDEPDETPICCDFCGEEALTVRRIALDGDYDRLRKAHDALYACSTCSEKKERQRLGLERGARRG